MHAPDGFLTAGTAVATGALSVAGIGVSLRRARDELSDRMVPLAGLTAAFVFAAQMVNFPIGGGVSGHLIGAALAAVLLGPWVGTLVVAVVVMVQALLFADGGITALGYNVLNMAIVPAMGGWAVFRAGRRVLPERMTSVPIAAGFAGFVSVLLSALAFSLEWLFGASAPVPFDRVLTAMLGVHTVIGIGEGLITGFVVAAVVASRPDLVVGAADLAAQPGSGRRLGRFVAGAAVATILVAVGVSQFAVDDPDGLESVAASEGFEEQGRDHALSSSWFADYATAGVVDEEVSLAAAGIAGVLVTLLVGSGVVLALRRSRPTRATAAFAQGDDSTQDGDATQDGDEPVVDSTGDPARHSAPT